PPHALFIWFVGFVATDYPEGQNEPPRALLDLALASRCAMALAGSDSRQSWPRDRERGASPSLKEAAYWRPRSVSVDRAAAKFLSSCQRYCRGSREGAG